MCGRANGAPPEVVNTALDRLAQDYRTEGKASLFDELGVFIKGSSEALPTYDALAGRLGIPAATLKAEIENREAGHHHEAGEADEDEQGEHDGQHEHEDANSARDSTHRHAPGTPPHKH